MLSIIKGKINGYKNLRDDVQYKVFLYDGTLSEMPRYPNIPETAIDLTVADDGTIHQDISEYLEPDIEYSFNIGIEYYGNYYIGDSKKIMKEATQEYIQQFESPYGYEVSKYIKSLGTGVDFTEYILPIIDWLNDQVFIQSVEYDQYYRNIQIKFSDGKDFYILTENRDLECTTNSLVNLVGLVYDVSEVKNEVIQENTNVLILPGIPYSFILLESDNLENIISPLQYKCETVKITDEYYENPNFTQLKDFGAIVIGKTHGTGNGNFLISPDYADGYMEDIINSCINGINSLILIKLGMQVDEIRFIPRKNISLEKIYSYNLNSPFVYANYC